MAAFRGYFRGLKTLQFQSPAARAAVNSVRQKPSKLAFQPTGPLDEPRVLFEDQHILIINKPNGMHAQPINPGLISHFQLSQASSVALSDGTTPLKRKLSLALPAAPSAEELSMNPKILEKYKAALLQIPDIDVLSYFKLLLKTIEHKPGNVFLALANRLDKPVSGVMILCKRSKSLEGMMESFRERKINKEYIAVVEGQLTGKGTIQGKETISNDQFWTEKSLNSKGNLNRTVAAKSKAEYLLRKRPNNDLDPRQKDGDLHYTPLHHFLVPGPGGVSKNGNFRTVVGLKCETGAKHQIRRQLSHIKHPIVGDWLYGSRTKLTHNGEIVPSEEKILLHAAKVEFEHPALKVMKSVSAPLPKHFLSGAKFDISDLGNYYYNETEADRLSSLHFAPTNN